MYFFNKLVSVERNVQCHQESLDTILSLMDPTLNILNQIWEFAQHSVKCCYLLHC